MFGEPNQYQLMAFDRHGILVHASPIHAKRVSTRTVTSAQRKWMARRAAYLKKNPGDYPLRNCGSTKLIQVWAIWDGGGSEYSKSFIWANGQAYEC